MTVSQAERERRMTEKGRSASFCVPTQFPLAAMSAQFPLSAGSAHSSSDEGEYGEQTFDAFLLAANGSAASKLSPTLKVKSGNSARRSQSCRIQGARPPRAMRNYDSPHDSTGAIDQRGSETQIDYGSEVACKSEREEDGSYNHFFLKKVGSCGRLTLPADPELEGSPALRRAASARRNHPSATSPNHSPTPTRTTRPTGSSSVKNRTPNRKGGTPTSCSARRATATTGFLEVRASSSAEGLDPEAYLLRNFSMTTKGFVNRGDSFRRRRSRSNSVQPPHEPSPLPSVAPQVGDILSVPCSPEVSSAKDSQQEESPPSERFRMAVVGATGVGKTALMNQFSTSECINAFDYSNVDDAQEETVSIVLNSIESEIVFVNITTQSELQEEMQRPNPANGWLLVYSVTDKSSFLRSKDDLERLQSASLLKGRALILAGNKCELVRSRAVSFEDGRDLACSFASKFMEISVGMNLKCDELLVGILHQLRLKANVTPAEGAVGASYKEKTPWTRNRSLMRASMKAKRLVTKIIGKSDSKHKQCEDFLN